MNTCFFLLHYPFITFLFIFLAVSLSSGEDTKYKSCSILYTCGSIQVGYPFWGDNRSKFCGIADLKLKCNDRSPYPTIDVYRSGYAALNVTHIDTFSHSMIVSPSKRFAECEADERKNNTSLISSLKPEPGYSNINLFYNCAKTCNRTYHSNTFNCSNDDDTYDPVYYFNNTSDISRIDKSCSCSSSLTFPMDDRGLHEFRTRNASLLSVLSKWSNITMSYVANFTACSKCEKSGGRCGSSEDPSSLDQFVCYCRDGHQPLMCKPDAKKKLKIILGTAFAAIGICCFIVLFFCLRRKRPTLKYFNLWEKNEKENKNIDALLEMYGTLATKRYTYTNIQKMSNYFSEKLGEGGYAIVYKGKLCNGRLVAVKLLKQSKGTGEDFVNEVASLDRTNHVNIVPLLGFCFEGKRRALIYDFMSNGSLEKFAYRGATEQALPWETLFSIALGIARGLEYLHRGCNKRILHLDIKPHNVLLDENFCPKISDFGLARLCLQQESTISMLEARGTIGYIAPEVIYRTIGGVSHKSDVYSYGMMILDIICGRKNLISTDVQRSSELYFPDWIYKRLQHGEEVAIHGVMNDEAKAMERKMILVSLWCLQTFPSNRPSMSRVIEMLQGDLELIQLPPKARMNLELEQLHSEARMDYNSSETISLSR